MASKIKVDQLETADGTGTIALQNQLSGMTNLSLPSGSILQVETLSRARTATTESTSTSHIVLNDGVGDVELSITPKFTDSTIVGWVSINGVAMNGSSTSMELTIFRNGSNWKRLDSHYGYHNSGQFTGHDNFTCHFSESNVGTTSAVTYSLRAKTNGTMKFFDTHLNSTIYNHFTLMEIKA